MKLKRCPKKTYLRPRRHSQIGLQKSSDGTTTIHRTRNIYTKTTNI